MGYASVRPPGLGTYPSIETLRPLRWSAFEECGVRQVRDTRWTGRCTLGCRAWGVLLEASPQDTMTGWLKTMRPSPARYSEAHWLRFLKSSTRLVRFSVTIRCPLSVRATPFTTAYAAACVAPPHHLSLETKRRPRIYRRRVERPRVLALPLRRDGGGRCRQRSDGQAKPRSGSAEAPSGSG